MFLFSALLIFQDNNNIRVGPDTQKGGCFSIPKGHFQILDRQTDT